jgi:DNA-binding transcriptional MerR regulator
MRFLLPIWFRLVYVDHHNKLAVKREELDMGGYAGAEVHDLVSRGSTIGSVCALFDLTPRAIRFYEEMGLISPGRDGRNRRVFDAATRRRLKLVGDLRRAGLPIFEIRALLEAGEANAARRRGQVMEKLRRRLQSLEQARQDLVQLMSALEAAA